MKLFQMRFVKLTVFALDIGMALASFFFVCSWGFGGQTSTLGWTEFLQASPWIVLPMVSTYYLFNLYDFAGRRKYSQLFYNAILAQLVFLAELLILSELLKAFRLPISAVVTACLLQLLLTLGLRWLLQHIQSSITGRRKALAIMSGGASDREVMDKLCRNGQPWLDIVQQITVSAIDSGREGQIIDPASWFEAEVLLLGENVPEPIRTEFIRLAGERQMEVLLIPRLYELYLSKAEPQQIGDLLVYSILPPHLTWMEQFMKRGLDLLVSSLLLLITSPLLLALYIIIPATSKGPALYVQERVGLWSKPFQLLKFRSMVNNAEQGTGPILAGESDSRITSLGRLMRASRLDELPQLINVLAGDMSLVGPRPERAFFIDQFTQELPYYNYRLMVKPGLTGLAQVMAGYTTSAGDKLRYDLMYMRNYSILLDMKLIAQTLGVVLNREQAKGLAEAPQAAEPFVAMAGGGKQREM